MNLVRVCIGVAIVVAGASLQGCVAAAIPLVAGGALARTGTDGIEASVEVERSEQPINPGSITTATPALTSAEIERDRLIAPGAGSLPSIFPTTSSRGFTDFVRYASRQAYYAKIGQDTPSALLSDPAALDGERAPCPNDEDIPPAILIDLDRGDQPFTPTASAPAAPSLALSLETLRKEGVAIAWISDNSAGAADLFREALATSGLDPEGKDRLLLLRYPGERKQTRRAALAAEACLIAIAGDDRSDFDELYEHLVNRDAALALEPLFGDGWFLISPPPSPALASTASDAAPNSDGPQAQ